MSTITTINATDKVGDSRAVINTNFSNLNTDKIETSYLDTDGTLAANSDAKIATQKAVKTYVDNVADTFDLFQYKGAIDASTNPDYPAANAGWSYRISVAGKIGGASGKNVEAGEYVICHVDSSASGDEAAVGANRTVFQVSFDPTNYLLKSTYDAHSVLYATTDNTPAALTVGEQTVVGRATGGNISALTIDSDLSSVSANDDTVPSAKATKTALDLKAPLASPTFTGTVTLPTVQLGETSIKLDAALSADGTWCGISEAGTGGETLAFGELCYFKAADSKWYKAKADAIATSGPVPLGFCVLAGASTTTEILYFGKIRADSLFPTFTVGAPVFVSGATAGVVTNTAPTTTDHVARIVGYGKTGDELIVQIDNTYYTHT